MTTLPAYALVTPARNEAEFIERTIASVVAQTILPATWVIVSDGSTDGTDEIVAKHARAHPWIVTLRMPDRGDRSFDGKALAVNAAYARIKHLSFDAVGNLDADVSCDPDHFEFLMRQLVADPTLGIVSTALKETYDYRFMSTDFVSGACQLFRRECFEAIDGYQPVANGGVDVIAVIAARMKGWRTRTFTERTFVHHRPFGAARRGPLAARFRDGGVDYALGGHPVWELARTVYQMTKPPFVIGGLTLLAGYGWSLVTRAERPVSRDLVAFRRREQMQRLRAFLAGARR